MASQQNGGRFVIVGLGTDIIEIVRIGRMVERHGEVFLNRVFTPDEIRYCQKRKESYQHFAGRWAAKEAVMKARGTGWIRGVGWQDIVDANDIVMKRTQKRHGVRRNV